MSLPTPREIKTAINPLMFYHQELGIGIALLKASSDGWSQNVRCPFHDDSTPSFGVNLKNGAFKCHGCEAHGGSVLDFYMARHGATLDEARAALASQCGVSSTDQHQEAAPQKPESATTDKPAPIPISDDIANTAPKEYPTLGKPSTVWRYFSPEGRLLCFVYRFDKPDGKTLRPCFWDGSQWQWKGMPEPRPLYNLHLLAKNPDALVVVCEGEKAADAAGRMLPNAVTTTSMNGAQSPSKTDWSPLKGRRILIWPDADAPGEKYALKVKSLAIEAGAAVVSILPPSAFGDALPNGWDAADAEAGGLSEKAREVIAQTEASLSTKVHEEAPKSKEEMPKAPEGWKLTTRWVFEEKEKADSTDYQPVCGPLWVVGRTNGTHGEWGLVLAYYDHNGHQKRQAIPSARLHEDPSILAKELSNLGLRIISGKERRLLSYLSSWDIEERILSARRLGWMENKAGLLSFVWPDAVTARGGNGEVIYQPERYSPTTRTVHSNGTLVDWLHQVATPVCQHPPMLFALCAGLTPAFLAFAEASDSFIIHFWGKTSRGKTTLGQIAASPWGCAADPNDAPSLTFVRRWNLTGNGLEGLAEAHSDLPLILDELGSATMGDIRPLVYQLSGGQGKTALTSAREIKEPRVWRTIVISTGELSLHARMEDPDGDGLKTRMVKGGLTHRALDVELSDIASGVPEAEREGVVSGIKVACARFYGTAGPELISRMVERFGTTSEVRIYINTRMAALMPYLTTKPLPAETARAVRRFALIAVAGEFAAQVGLIPTTPEVVVSAVREVVDAWLGVSGETDDTRIVDSVRSFILRHESRFQSVSMEFAVPNRVGYVNHNDGLWMFTAEGLKEAAPGNDVVTIARAVRRAGHLHSDSDTHLAYRAYLGDGSRPRLYAVRKAIVDGEEAEIIGYPDMSVGRSGTLGLIVKEQQDTLVPHAKHRWDEVGRNHTKNVVPIHRTNFTSHSSHLVPLAKTGVGRTQHIDIKGVVPLVPPIFPETGGTEDFSDSDPCGTASEDEGEEF